VKKFIGKITIFTVFSATFASGMFLVAAWTVDDALTHQTALRFDMYANNAVTATSYVVFDQETGIVLASKNPSAVLPIASVTKLLTASMVYEQSDVSATTTITWADVNTYGDAGKLYPYTEYSVRELTYPLLLESSNDAAAALSRVDTTLIERMNQKVSDLGLVSTAFADASGLSPNDVSSASELAKLASELFKTHQHVFNITQLDQFVGTHTGWRNNNPLSHADGYKGGKHGYTVEAGKTAVAFFDEVVATGQTRTVGYIVLQSV
jgi:serine-type D-Ala-D-Ala endopeptidase (penicillin-binding protein 7)